MNFLLNSFLYPALGTFRIELRVPHASALIGGLGSRLAALNYVQLAILQPCCIISGLACTIALLFVLGSINFFPGNAQNIGSTKQYIADIFK
jgi:hypothetical protein